MWVCLSVLLPVLQGLCVLGVLGVGPLCLACLGWVGVEWGGGSD